MGFDFSDIEEVLENPANIEEPERRQIMENVERHYRAALEATDPNIRQYELEAAKKEIERYNWELGVSRGVFSYGNE